MRGCCMYKWSLVGSWGLKNKRPSYFCQRWNEEDRIKGSPSITPIVLSKVKIHGCMYLVTSVLNFQQYQHIQDGRVLTANCTHCKFKLTHPHFSKMISVTVSWWYSTIIGVTPLCAIPSVLF